MIIKINHKHNNNDNNKYCTAHNPKEGEGEEQDQRSSHLNLCSISMCVFTDDYEIL